MKKWEAPKMLTLNSLPQALGNCMGGSSQEPLACHNGEVTSGSGVGHHCQNGGCAGPFFPTDCNTGTTVGTPCN